MVRRTIRGSELRGNAACWGFAARRSTTKTSGETPKNLALMKRLDEIFLDIPFLAPARWPGCFAGRGIGSTGSESSD